MSRLLWGCDIHFYWLVRVVLLNGEPWWVAKDVCEALGIANHRDAVGRLPVAMKDDVAISDAIGNPKTRVVELKSTTPLAWRGVTSVVTPSGSQDMAVLSEQGLYLCGASYRPARDRRRRANKR